MFPFVTSVAFGNGGEPLPQRSNIRSFNRTVFRNHQRHNDFSLLSGFISFLNSEVLHGLFLLLLLATFESSVFIPGLGFIGVNWVALDRLLLFVVSANMYGTAGRIYTTVLYPIKQSQLNHICATLLLISVSLLAHLRIRG